MNCLTHSGVFKSLWTRPLYRAGNLYTWGAHSLGCGINHDSQSDQLRPRRIDAFNGNVQKVYPSEYFTAVITDNGDLYTFGNNNYGQLGLGNTEEQQTPQLVKYFRDKGLKVVDVALGSNHGVALASDGNVYTWGSANNSFLDQLLCRPNGLGDNYANNLLQPQVVEKLAGSPKGKFVSAGINYSIVVNENNQVYVWGAGKRGELGNGCSLNFKYPDQIWLTQSKKIKSCFAGTLALLNEGIVVGWGRSYYGSLGVRQQEYVVTDLENYSPTPVNLKYFQPNEKVVDFDLGYNLSLFLTDQNRIYLSGYDETYVPRPIDLPKDEKILKFSASNNSFAILTDKNFYTSNEYVIPQQKRNLGFLFKSQPRELFESTNIEQFGGGYRVRYAVVNN
ncbi:unnamed protein product (macronuclear) [Paramecium tetraurelia]|uniref:RCC1-like domain-containing protein n=1 Tax=Paramecium tetraurelia TaxID=5888 RepID=A0C9L9_PARTE|nr:uncharacterized protein GSPATT00006792001 [Paramecium tetraurelia]CAK67486.1 unnamed protein product [Paramecium tetraurelia]|eukprot:XP_001434883.1 hypothetical protein (macronuclear) [Paramecium tetraurelia strain d4-2]